MAALERSAPPALLRVGERIYAAGTVERARAALLAAVDAFHERNPLRGGIDREELRRALPAHGRPAPDAAALADALVSAMAAEGTLRVKGNVVARSGFIARLSEEQAAARERLAGVYEAAALAAPSLDELPAELKKRKDFWPLLKLLEAEGRLVPIAPESYVSAAALREAEVALRAALAAGALKTSELKAVLPVSRKHLIPLLEFFDRSGVTVRKGEERVLAS